MYIYKYDIHVHIHICIYMHSQVYVYMHMYAQLCYMKQGLDDCLLSGVMSSEGSDMSVYMTGR